MTAIAVSSQKGGVGKTTVALNLGLSLARRGWRTLVVDADPAGAIGLSLTKRLSEAEGFAEYVQKSSALNDVLVRTRVPELAILPVGRVAPEDSVDFHAALTDGALFGKLLEETSAHFDLVLIDTPSGFGGVTLGAIRACPYVLCPVQAEPIAARSALRILDLVGALREQGHDVGLAGFLVTMVLAGQRNSRGVLEDLRRVLPAELLFGVNIPRDAAFLDASAAGVPVGLLSRRVPGVALAFDQLAAEFEVRAGLVPQEAQDEPIALVD